MQELERWIIAALERLGVLMTNTCINYQTIMPPVRSEHVAMGDTEVATAWMLHEMAERGIVPMALLFNRVNPILAQGAAFAGVLLLDGFETDITEAVATGDELLVEPWQGRVAVLKGAG